jgi:hypothetical protein
LRLIDEILRCASVFDRLGDHSAPPFATPQLRALLRAKNGTLALSGALVLFGWDRDATMPMDITHYADWIGRVDYGLQSSDEIFGADIFGDLLFARSGAVYRLDGETGDHVLIGDIDTFLNQPLSEIAEELGGTLGREHFADRAIGEDPLRLLPNYPFMMKEHVRGEFFETPLTRAVDLKYRLFTSCRNAPEGAGIDCTFWRAL